MYSDEDLSDSDSSDYEIYEENDIDISHAEKICKEMCEYAPLELRLYLDKLPSYIIFHSATNVNEILYKRVYSQEVIEWCKQFIKYIYDYFEIENNNEELELNFLNNIMNESKKNFVIIDTSPLYSPFVDEDYLCSLPKRSPQYYLKVPKKKPKPQKAKKKIGNWASLLK